MNATIVRNPNNGKIVKNPTSSNVEDAWIPREGVDSNIMAKNVMVGDRLRIPGMMGWRVEGVHFIPETSTERPLMCIVATNRNVRGNKSRLRIESITMCPFERIMIRETPRMRAERRRMTRRGARYDMILGG